MWFLFHFGLLLCSVQPHLLLCLIHPFVNHNGGPSTHQALFQGTGSQHPGYSSSLWSRQCAVFSAPFTEHHFFKKIWVLCWGGEKQEVGKKYPQRITQSGGGLNAMDRELHRGQPSCRWREHSKFCSQSHPPASPLCSTPVCYNLMAWSSAIRNGGLSLHEAVLLAFSSLPKRFFSGPAKSLAGSRLMAWLTAVPPFRNLGRRSSIFRGHWSWIWLPGQRDAALDGTVCEWSQTELHLARAWSRASLGHLGVYSSLLGFEGQRNGATKALHMELLWTVILCVEDLAWNLTTRSTLRVTYCLVSLLGLLREAWYPQDSVLDHMTTPSP